MNAWSARLCLLVAIFLAIVSFASGATTLRHYYGHDAVEDREGVIAPWYTGQNGQFDFRVRIAAETMKRYAWAGKDKAVLPAPEFVYNGTWSIDEQGNITVPKETDWANGDVGQRAAYLIRSMMEYYRYSGDPAALAIISTTADYVTSHCETPANHGWPGILISVPNMGVRYGDCRLGTSDELNDGHGNGHGKIQLDIVAEVGLQLVRAYEMLGEKRWYDAAKHWADLLAENRRHDPSQSPWGRYANNANGAGMNGIQTGGVVYILTFFDELIRTGYTGKGNEIVAARDDGRAYLRSVLLPIWWVDDTFGRNYWDWEQPVQAENITEFAVLYMMDHKDYFPNWKNDVRNLLSLFLNHTSVSPKSNSDVFSGAWAYPESSDCCERSLWYGPMELSSIWARYSVETESEWAREIARRSQILATYDPLDNGRSMDLIDGGSFVSDTWFKIAHPMALDYVLKTMAWLPDIMGANRENHLMRVSEVVKQVTYGKDKITYTTFDAPIGGTDQFRLAYSPKTVNADGKELSPRSDLKANGYTVRSLTGGDFIVTIRHDRATKISLSGADPQMTAEDRQIIFSGRWNAGRDQDDSGGGSHVASESGASMSYTFTGNQVRLVGRVSPKGGRADVFLDDAKQLVPVDCFSPIVFRKQILYYRNGLADGPHTLKIVVRGEHNPASGGDEVFINGVQYSAATGESDYGVGGGPAGFQRMVFGYTNRTDYRDSQGNLWRPATEFIARTGHQTDAVAKTWWIMRQAVFVDGTPDPELYRYGVHLPELTVNSTVAPGTYHLRLKFAETQYLGPNQRGITIYINGEKVAEGLDVWATAGGAKKAVDLVFNDIRPQNGVIALRLVGSKIGGCQTDAMLQALEVGPGDGGQGANPRSIATVSASGNPTPIIYVQAVRYQSSVTPEKAQVLLQSLKNTLQTIPQVKSVEVGSVVDDSQKQYDYAVVMRFDNLEDKHAYGESEVHRRWVKDNNVLDLIDKHLMLTIQSYSSGQ
jgi:hypothetical protein